MGDGYKNRGSNAAGLGFKNRGAKLLDGAVYVNRGATDGTHETFKNRGQAWGTGVFYNRSVSDFASLSILGSAAFYAPLKSTLVLTRGTGNPTYSRATAAWEMDNEGKLITVPSGGARFGGGRMVRNLLASTATMSTQNVTTLAATYTLSIYGTGSVTLSGTATGTLSGTGASDRVQTTFAATAGTLTLTVAGSVTSAQLENVSGQSDQTASEYVSVGVLSAPYHGAGVDGVKWFETNKAGTALSESSLLGYHAEGARTNSLLYSRDLTNAAWAATNITPAKTATGIDNSANSASTLTAGAADATILQTLTLAAAARSSSAYVKRRTGTGNIYMTRDGGTNWTDITASVGASWTRVKIENSSVLNPSIGFKIATSGDAIDVDVVQDEAGAFISSPIITTTAAVTRNADVLTYAVGNINNSTGAILFTAMTTIPGGIGLPADFVAPSANGGVYIPSGDARTSIKSYDGTNFIQKTGLSDITTGSRKRAVSYSGSSLSITGDGLTPATGSFDGSFGSATSVIVGTSTTAYTYFKSVYIWQTALSDAQLQQVTT